MTNFINSFRNFFSKSNSSIAATTASDYSLQAIPLNVPTGAEPVRILLDEHAFVEAGLNKGRPEALQNGLNNIISGKYVDERVGQAQHEAMMERLKLQREDMRLKKNQPESRLQHVLQHLLPSLHGEIKSRETELAGIDLSTGELMHKAGYNAFRFWLTIVAFAGLTIFIYLFYSSAVYTAFFRDPAAEISAAEVENDFSALFNTAFNIHALSCGIPAVYFGPFLFFAFALVWAGLQQKLKTAQGNKRWLYGFYFIAFFLVAIAADFILAWKVELASQELKLANGILNEPAPFHESFLFWGVLVMGLGGYVAWKILADAIVRETEKKNPRRLAAMEKEKLKRLIRLSQNDILKLRAEEVELQRQISDINNELNKIDILLDRSYRGLGDVEHSLDAYYRGWLRYVTGHPNQAELLPLCEQVYARFRQSFMAWQPVQPGHFAMN